jgi:RNA polymerase sigma factor (sigma-70 family)
MVSCACDAKMRHMDDSEWLARRFEDNRPRLRAVAYRMLGSITDAEDAVQDTWERVNRAGSDEVENLSGWLTTILARVCLNMLRARNIRHEESLEAYVPDPIVRPEGELLPEDEALLADSVGLALQVVIDTLTPAERLAFVLHDMFDLPFDEISAMMGRTPAATRQLATRARRRLKGADLSDLERDVARQRAVVDAFFAAGRAGNFEALVAVLHPDVVLRADFSPSRPRRSVVVRGATAVARQARFGASTAAEVRPALVNGAAGAVITMRGKPFSVLAFSIAGGQITEIDAIGDPERVARVTADFLKSADA